MKWRGGGVRLGWRRSLPVRGAWVEIYCSGGVTVRRRASLPVRGAWVEMQAVMGAAG